MKNVSLVVMAVFIAIYVFFGDASAIDLGITKVPINIAEIAGPGIAGLLTALGTYFPQVKNILSIFKSKPDPIKLLNDLEILVGQCPDCRASCSHLREKLLDKKFNQEE